MRLVAIGCKKDETGQNLIEYAIVAAIVAAIGIAMSIYVYRSVQATQQMIQRESGEPDRIHGSEEED